MFFHRLLESFIQWFLGRSGTKAATKQARGLTGRFALSLGVLPLLVVPLLIWGALVAFQDEQSGGQLMAFAAAVLAIFFVIAALHILSFRLILDGAMLRSKSWLFGEKQIDLTQAFAAEFQEEKKTLRLNQQAIRIDIHSIISGYREFWEAIAAIHAETRGDAR